MDKLALKEEFLRFMKPEAVLMDEPMKKHTSFKIGGPADLLLMPTSIEEIKRIIDICNIRKAPYFVMGNGSNLLVTDRGIRKVAIKIADNFNAVNIVGTKIIAQAGLLLSTLSNKALKESLSGLEFASGIPGTLGGAVAMNAGAYGGEMKNVITSCKVLDREGKIKILPIDEMEMGYRTSMVQTQHLIVLEVEMLLEKKDYSIIKDKVDELNMQRTTKQPLHLPSAGSVFKRPEGNYAGKLIQDCNLKGYRIGGAQVSELHSGFIVNVGNASAEDVINLIKHIQTEVKSKFNIQLQTEVKIMGEN
ncbi:UDP-N-acetylmuramate dehydrogenase [Alkaliphilus pronyensis]|uniref:UDP-N-acetylenolpyruvoylglucosamine reductase n=1 Tax=Alkaliphilus pronyensis TaxID=1482732 RepID=A0A6I0FF87_9FIRM|nr:UDP-N-acetylmuramate dehydrogenase [Alkaliphilus pronyensis]KAB3537867.1 UDP-N-acetylmuramate dehydrogenase [Alkaliphilus pronyensis]